MYYVKVEQQLVGEIIYILCLFFILHIFVDDLHDTKSLYRSTQEELINIQTMFKKGKLNIQEVEDKFELWKTRPEVIKANTNHKTEVDEMKLEWEKLRKDVMNKKNDEGTDIYEKNSLKTRIKVDFGRTTPVFLKKATISILFLKISYIFEVSRGKQKNR